PPQEGLATLLESVALASDVDQMEEAGPDRVTLLTLHAAKGLEYPVVFIPGVEERVLPHSRSLDDPEGMAEERRLFYVGLTRARRKLYVVHAYRRTIFGSSEMAEPSRFLNDLPPDTLDQPQPVTRSGRTAAASSGAYARATHWATPQPGVTRGAGSPGARPGSVGGAGDAAGRDARSKAAPRGDGATGPRFKPGDKVRHGHFGQGTVISSHLRDADEEVTVAFAGAGVKKLMQAFAKLEKV
ncbi:MAG: ATP-binding domain-containing protein, partial [Chloroflexi bacterium]|nr:ATP-binding domain-containing protein [Chloroflexota bacterium]